MKTRSNTAAAILSNTTDLEEAYVQALEAEGSALEENEKYLDSIQGRIDLFNNSVQTMWSNVLETSWVKKIVDIGTGLIKIVDRLGLVKTLVFAIGTYLIKKHFKGDLFGGIFGESIDDMKYRLESLKAQWETAKNEFGGNSKQATKKEKQYNKYNEAVSPYIEEYDELVEKFKDYRAAAANAKQELDNFNKKLSEKSEITREDIEEQDRLAQAYDEANEKVEQTGIELEKIEAKAQKAGSAGLISSQKFKIGFQNAKASIKKFGKEMISSMVYAAAFAAVMESITLIFEGIGDLIEYIFQKDTFEDLQEELEQTESELSNVESEIQSLNTELDNTNKRIEELMDQGTLSYVEQEELENLRSATEELEAQIELQETLRQAKQTSVNTQAITATDAYFDTSFASDVTRTEKQEKWAEHGENIGKILGTAIGAFGFLATPAVGAATMVLGNSIGGAIGGWIGEAAAGAVYDSEQTVGEAMDNMIAERDNLLSKQKEALANEDAEAYNEATDALATYDGQMAKHISQIQENYNAMDWDSMSEDDEGRKRMIEYADWLSKYNISMDADGAKSNAIARIFGEEASSDVKDLKKDIEEAMAAAKDSGVEPDFDFQAAFNSDNLVEFKRRLYDMGLTVTDVEYYFLDLAKAEKEAEDSYKTYDTVKEIESLSDGVNSLKDAFTELSDEGYVSMSTLVSLSETFGSLGDAWDNFVDTVATGSGTIEQATASINELLEAYLSDKLNNGPMGAEERLKTILLLQQMGIKNAKEYVDAMQKSAVISNIAEAIVSDDKKEAELKEKIDSGKATEEEESEYNKLMAKTYAEYIKQFEQQYNIDLTPEEERLLIEKAITAEKAKQNALEKEKALNEYTGEQNEYQTAVDENSYIDEQIQKVNEVTNADYSNFGVTKSTKKFLGFDFNVWTYKGKEYTDVPALVDGIIADLESNRVEVPEQPVSVVTESDVENAQQAAEDAANAYQDALDEIGLTIDVQLGDFNNDVDKIQGAYDSLRDIIKDYNENRFLSIDNLQTLLSLEPEYLACLQMENGQLSINQAALEAMVQAKLAEAKATVVQSAMKQLDALAAREEADAINESQNASTNAISGLGAYANALSGVAQDAIVAAGSVAAFNAAVEGAQANELVSQSEIDTILSNMNTQLQMIDSVSANLSSSFSDIMSPGSREEDAQDALEKLREKYERKISNLDNQQTYLQNEIDRLEAEDNVVSKSYYEEQIRLEQKKLALYKQELAALKKLEMTDEVADALWEVEHAIQESTMRMVEFRQSIIDLYVDAFDKLIEAYDNKDDFLTDQQDYIDKYRELMELQGEVPSSYGYQEQIANEEEKLAANIAELEDLRAALAEAMANSDLQEGDEEWVEMQDKIRDCESAILDNKIAIEEYRDELKQLSVDAFDIVRDAFGYKDSFLTTQQDYIEGYADYLEALNVDVPTEVYDKLIEIEQQKRENNVADLVSAREQFAEIEAAGYTAADEEWQDAYSTITDLEKKIQDSDLAMAEWAQTIRDMDFEKFDRFIDRLNDINSEIENLRGLYDDDDVALEDGTWTEEGITSLGLAYQQMELAKQQSQEYAEKIEELNEAYNNGEMSEQEYYERLQELKDGQWDAIDAYESAKDAIVDLEEARIDMIEEGINEEIEAYEELIQLKKDELDAERDLYEFKKDVEKQTKDIATLERRIASLSGSTSASDIAERRKLEAELREAKEGLNDTYYSHAKDQQGQALDDELEAYQEAKENYLETLREALEDTEEIISEKINEVLMNADVVLNGINKTAGEYGVTLSSSLMLPWQQAAQESLAFKATIDTNLPILNNTITMFNDDIKAKFESMFAASGTAAQTFNTAVSTVISNVRTVVENASSPLTASLRYPWENLTSAGGPINTFSTKSSNTINTALQTAQNNAASMTSALTSPWNAGSNAATTFSTNISRVMDDAVTKARSAYSQISSYANLAISSYDSISDTAPKINTTTAKPDSNVKALQEILNSVFSAGLTVDGIWGSRTESALKKVQEQIKNFLGGKGYRDLLTVNGKFDAKTRQNMSTYFDLMAATAKSNDHPEAVSTYTNAKKKLPVAFHAKGTIGTKKDEWAITDEPWLGDELTMYATKQGTLSYMRVGSTVIPADLTKELMEIGEIGVDGLTMPKINSGVNLMSNYISKPEFNLSFDALVKAEKITEDTLPEVKKFVKQEINSLVKQMNYALKGVGSR